MNRRGKRLTLGVMVVGLAVVLVLGIAHWDTVRDHVEAWHFQLTRETGTIEPDPNLAKAWGVDGGPPPWRGLPPGRFEFFKTGKCLRLLAAVSGVPLILDLKQYSLVVSSGDNLAWDFSVMTPDALRKLLESAGVRVLEQHFPRRAYVVIRDKDARIGLQPWDER